MMQILLEPIDVWLFRDGKPFDALSDHRARSLFPPYPTVMQGVIRSHQLVLKRVDLCNAEAVEAAVGTVDEFGTLCLRGPFIARQDEQEVKRYFAVPADVVWDDHNACRLLQPMARDDASGVLTSGSEELPMLLWPPSGMGRRREAPGEWMAEDQLLQCLKGGPAKATRSETLFVDESRFGIGLDDGPRTAREGALYQVEFTRPCPGVGLWLEVDGYDAWPETGLLRVGGEGRAARFRKMDTPLTWPEPPDPLPARFKVYFASPTFFKGGWRPGQGWGQFFDGDVVLQAVALRGYESVGGFDWARKAHKPAYRYVPAGSVYYFTHTGTARLKPELVNRAITERWPEIGFGQVIINEWRE